MKLNVYNKMDEYETCDGVYWRGIMKIFAMSDIHGCLQEFEEALSLVDLSGENMLILLGDYIHGPNSYGVLEKIINLQRRFGTDKVIALMGNHETMVIEGRCPISGTDGEGYNDYDEEDDKYIDWMMSLPFYYATEHQIFCHAGIDEESEDMWELGTGDYIFTEKYPAEMGEFYMDIIAGHIGTSVISGNSGFHDIYYDGYAHYYVDGTVLNNGVIPVIMVDTNENKYYRVTEAGKWLILPYNQEN